MSCLRRFTLVLILLVQIAAFGFTLLVIGSAGILGEAAVINATDATIVFILSAIALAGTILLAIMLWFGGRKRRQLAREREALTQERAAAPATEAPWGRPTEHAGRFDDAPLTPGPDAGPRRSP